MNLRELYLLRTNFTVIGLTGRTGSGCSKIAEILSKDFENLKNKGLREESEFTDDIFKRKYLISKDFLEYKNNWVPFQVIKYVDVLMFFILNKLGANPAKIKKLLSDNYRESGTDNNSEIVAKILAKIETLESTYEDTIREIKSFGDFNLIRTDEELRKLGDIFYGQGFKKLKAELFDVLEQDGGYNRTRYLLHFVSCNIRSSGSPLRDATTDIKHIYTIAKLINRLIKAKKIINQQEPTKIVIDSLRNSLEIMFFKERYSAFYMVATKDIIGNTKKRVEQRIKGKYSDKSDIDKVVNKILELDEIEYRTKDFAKGRFSSPDVENCIQKSDYHIFNIKKEQIGEDTERLFGKEGNLFLTREEQLMKLISLIQQPGLITPSAAERTMQIANTAKLNSGCISRKVGAVVTDVSYYVKAIGWNDVAKGHTPCNLRSVKDFLGDSTQLNSNPHYSPFEKGNSSETSTYKYKNKTPSNFKEALNEYFKNFYETKHTDLNGKNCSFCFKTVHNHFEGEANQVHTRSLHAEENAMLQITKLGGMGSQGGYLFTTASPCELCAKKAYQLGITKIFYIDPYPGISVDQILRGGQENTQPLLIPFYGAIGNAYHELYDGFMSYKDEISMTLEIKQEQKISKELGNVLGNIEDPEINAFLQENNLNDDEVKALVKKAIKMYKKEV